MQAWLVQHQATTPSQLSQSANGYIFIGDTPLINISATEIREKLNAGDTCSELIPETVLQYIHQQHLYQR